MPGKRGGYMAKNNDIGALVRLFLKLGIIGFGGPAAHIAMLEDEVVTRRQWLTREHFLDLLGATNLIPGPNSTEMAIHVGYVRGGWRGLVLAGVCFVLPAVLITTALAWVYVEYGTLPEAEPLLRGIKPVVLAVIVGALWKLGQKAVKDWRLLMVGIAVAAIAFQQGYEIPALFCGGLVGMFWRRFRPGQAVGWAAVASLGLVDSARAAVLQAGTAVEAVSIWKLGLFFLKIGAVLYGSGYVLFAFLEGGLVRDYGLLTQAQLLDAVAVGQFTPGPVLSTATFIGYVIAGPLGALVATVGIFLPSFFFVAAVNPLIPRLRQSAWAGAFLDGVNVSAVGLMVAVMARLGQTTLIDLSAWAITTIAFLVMWRWQVSAAWLVLAGAVTGYILWH
jgi:chromate transporter